MMKAGTIFFGGSRIDCLVRHMSVGGANLGVESQIGIPGSFDLGPSKPSTAITLSRRLAEGTPDRRWI
jgi:hypothetical protein